MNRDWKYAVAGDDAKTVNLHDCIITEWECGDGCMALIFGGGFCVSDGNKYNKTGRHLITGRSALILRGGALTGAVIPEHEIPVNGKLEKQPAVTLDPADCWEQNIEIIDWNFDGKLSEFHINGSLLNTIGIRVYSMVNLRFACTEVIYCWDGYAGDAWYEGHHRYKAMEEAFYRLGFENHEVILNKIYDHNFGGWTGKFDRFFTLKHPNSDVIYFINHPDNNFSLVIMTAPDHAAAADNAFTVAMRFDESINAAELGKYVELFLRREHFIAPGILPGVWHEVRDDADIELLQIYFMHFHDSFIVGLDYTTGFSNVSCEHIESGWPYNYVVNLRVQSPAVMGAPVIELRFEDVKRCSFTGAFTEFLECYLKFASDLDRYKARYIVWAGDPGFDPHNVSGELIGGQTANFVAAGGLKWRLMPEVK